MKMEIVGEGVSVGKVAIVYEKGGVGARGVILGSGRVRS